MSNLIVSPYQWDLRPQIPVRPEWFRAWPNGATLALQILILNEWESVPRHRKRPMAVDLQNRHDYQNKCDFLALGVREYGARHGIWRLLDVLRQTRRQGDNPDERLDRGTFPGNRAREPRSRPRGRRASMGHERLSADVHVARRRTVCSRRNRRGDRRRHRQQSSRLPFARSAADALHARSFDGKRLLWTSDYVDSDFPYAISRNDRRIVAISYATPGYTDGDLSSRGIIQGLAEIKYAFDATLEESKRHPMKFCYAIHPHVSGTVGMARLLDDVLAHVRSRGEIWLPTCSDIAEFWLAGMVR